MKSKKKNRKYKKNKQKAAEGGEQKNASDKVNHVAKPDENINQNKLNKKNKKKNVEKTQQNGPKIKLPNPTSPAKSTDVPKANQSPGKKKNKKNKNKPIESNPQQQVVNKNETKVTENMEIVAAKKLKNYQKKHKKQIGKLKNGKEQPSKQAPKERQGKGKKFSKKMNAK